MKLITLYEDVVADAFGKELKRALGKPEAFDILDSDPSANGGTFTQGGCFALANALHDLIPTSEVWGIYRDGGKGIKPRGYADHFVLRIGELFYDSSGGKNASRMLSMWKVTIRNPALQKSRPVDVHPETPHGKDLIQKIKHYLLADDAFKQALFNIGK